MDPIFLISAVLLFVGVLVFNETLKETSPAEKLLFMASTYAVSFSSLVLAFSSDFSAPTSMIVPVIGFFSAYISTRVAIMAFHFNKFDYFSDNDKPLNVKKFV